MRRGCPTDDWPVTQVGQHLTELSMLSHRVVIHSLRMSCGVLRVRVSTQDE